MPSFDVDSSESCHRVKLAVEAHTSSVSVSKPVFQHSSGTARGQCNSKMPHPSLDAKNVSNEFQVGEW